MHDHIMDWGKFWVVHIHSYFFNVHSMALEGHWQAVEAG